MKKRFFGNGYNNWKAIFWIPINIGRDSITIITNTTTTTTTTSFSGCSSSSSCSVSSN